MNINELKVGDRVKYTMKGLSGYFYEGTICCIRYDNSKNVNINPDCCYGTVITNEENIISKLEPIKNDNIKTKDRINKKLNEITVTISPFEAAKISSEILDLTKQLYKIEYKEIPIEKEENAEAKLLKLIGDWSREEFRKHFMSQFNNILEESKTKGFKFDYIMTGYDLWIPEDIRIEMGNRMGKRYTIELKETDEN